MMPSLITLYQTTKRIIKRSFVPIPPIRKAGKWANVTKKAGIFAKRLEITFKPLQTDSWFTKIGARYLQKYQRFLNIQRNTIRAKSLKAKKTAGFDLIGSVLTVNLINYLNATPLRDTLAWETGNQIFRIESN